jgi:hypothetical protein
MNRILIAALAAATVAVGSTTAAFAQAKPMASQYLPSVKIEQCFVTVPKGLSKKASGTQIVYVNETHHVLSSVTFAVGYRNSDHNFLRRVTDEGSFAPGAPINHHFSLYSDVIFGGKATTTCGAVSAK